MLFIPFTAEFTSNSHFSTDFLVKNYDPMNSNSCLYSKILEKL